jgi:transposase-like protein
MDRFALSYRDVEDMLAERGIDVSYETVRRWALKFGGIIAHGLGRTGDGISTKCSSLSTADSCMSGVPWTAKARFWTSSSRSRFPNCFALAVLRRNRSVTLSRSQSS